MLLLGASTPIVDWSAIWKICLVTLIAGAGIVVVFGFLLLGLRIANSSGTDGTQAGTSRFTGYALSLVCGVVVVGVIALGLVAMIDKPSSSPAKPKKSAAVMIAPGHQPRSAA